MVSAVPAESACRLLFSPTVGKLAIVVLSPNSLPLLFLGSFLVQSFFVLYESASGYALMEVVEAEEVGSLLEEVQQAVLDPQRFCRTVKLKGFQPFTTAENALENVNAISEQMVTDDLKVSGHVSEHKASYCCVLWTAGRRVLVSSGSDRCGGQSARS